jgi:hypothetical protein
VQDEEGAEEAELDQIIRISSTCRKNMDMNISCMKGRGGADRPGSGEERRVSGGDDENFRERGKKP